MKHLLLFTCLLALGLTTLRAQTRYSQYTAASKEMVFSDDFYDNRNDWYTYNYEYNTIGKIENGHYVLRSLEDEPKALRKLVDFDEARNFEIEVRLKYDFGEDNNFLGVSWGRDSNGNRYRFGYTANGYYRIDKYENQQWHDFVTWTESGLISSEGYNKLTVRKINGYYYYFLNETYLTRVPFERFFGNHITLQVNQNTQMSVDWIRISYLNDPYNAPPQIVVTSPDVSRGFTSVQTASVNIRGYATDNDGIASVYINNQPATLSGNQFYTTLPVQRGNQTITVVATDNRQASATRTFSIERTSGGGGAISEKRLALIIGNATYYSGGSLANPVNDANSMKMALEKLGFRVLKYENSSQSDMKRAIDEFGKELEDYDVGLFFYAGHGVQVNGENYLIPTDATLESENDVEYDCVQAGRVLAKMEAAESKTNIVILDACRNNPFERSWNRSSGGQGLAFMNAPSGSLIAYATSPGNTASDGTGSNGLYTSAILEHINSSGVSVLEMFQEVRKTVKARSQDEQIPWESTSLDDNFYFKP